MSNPNTNLTPAQRLTCLLALLDEIIKLDEKRTPGEWAVNSGYPFETLCSSGVRTSKCKLTELGKLDASFIANASVSHGRNARALRVVVKFLLFSIYSTETYGGTHQQQVQIAEILSFYPDEILQKYLK